MHCEKNALDLNHRGQSRIEEIESTFWLAPQCEKAERKEKRNIVPEPRGSVPKIHCRTDLSHSGVVCRIFYEFLSVMAPTKGSDGCHLSAHLIVVGYWRRLLHLAKMLGIFSVHCSLMHLQKRLVGKGASTTATIESRRSGWKCILEQASSWSQVYKNGY